MGLWNSPRSQLELTKSCGACTAHWLQSGQVLGLGFLRGHSAAPGVACEFAYCFACSDPQTSIWVGSSVAESAEFPGCWEPELPRGACPPHSSCSTLSALASSLTLSSGSTENQVAGTKIPPPLQHKPADSENRRLLRGDPDPCQAQVAGELGNPRTQGLPGHMQGGPAIAGSILVLWLFERHGRWESGRQ